MFVQIVIAVLVIYLIYRFITPTRPNNFPPGPKDVPLLGGAYMIRKLDADFSTAMGKLGEKYGPVVGINLGMMRSLIITGYEASKHVLLNEEFQGRPSLFISTFFTAGRALGIMFANGELWQEQRRFTLRHLRDFGFGKSSMEEIIHEEVQDLIEGMKKRVSDSADSVVSIRDAFGPPIINVLWAIMAGKRYSHDDPKFNDLLSKLYRLFRSGSPAGNLVNDWPYLRFFPPFSTAWNTIAEGRKAVHDMLEEEINSHMATRDKNHNRDFIDVYLNEIDNKGESAGFFKEQLKAVCADLFSAGGESTSNSVAFGMLYMLLYPEIQEKVQKELDTVVGKSRLPSYNDRPNLPYTEAVLNELLRIASIAPTTVPHATTQDCKIMGYDVPKDTFILVMLSSVHNEKSYWGDPEVFRPERFIGPDGAFLKNDHLFAFGIGKRNCLGEILARVNYFDFFTAMLQNFRLELIPGNPRPSTVPTTGFTLSPQPFQAKIILR